MTIRVNFNDIVIDPEGLKDAAVEIYSLAAALAMQSGNFTLRCPGFMDVKLNPDGTATAEFFGMWPTWATQWGSVLLRHDSDKSRWTAAGTLATQVRDCAQAILDAMCLDDVPLRECKLPALYHDAERICRDWKR